jgi:hypothetical protein
MALLDLFDAKTWIPVIIAWVAMIFFGSTNTSWSPQSVVVAAFVVAASGVKERVHTDALNRYEFVVDGKTLTFREPTNRFYYENLTIKAARLEEAIQKLMEHHQ